MEDTILRTLSNFLFHVKMSFLSKKEGRDKGKKKTYVHYSI